MFFSDPVCILVFKECEKWNAMDIILKGKQDTFKSDVWYSKIFVFSFIDVLLNFVKHLVFRFLELWYLLLWVLFHKCAKLIV